MHVHIVENLHKTIHTLNFAKNNLFKTRPWMVGLLFFQFSIFLTWITRKRPKKLENQKQNEGEK